MLMPWNESETMYAWTIDREHISEPTAVGTVGPRNAPDALTAKLAAGEGHRFKMFDDDGGLYYEGRCISEDPEFGGEEFFGPLNDFGMPNAGCTEIQYRSEKGDWETL